MDKLKDLFDINQLNQANFEAKAEELINNYCIKKGDKTYEFVEVEFYLFTKDHPDVITYPREAMAGDWFFHSSGVDICFSKVENGEVKMSSKDCCGGILIRSLREVDGEGKTIKTTNGPLKCCEQVLFDRFSAINPNPEQYPRLVARKPDAKKYDVKHTERFLNFSNPSNKRAELIKSRSKLVGENSNFETRYDEFYFAKYRFFIDNPYKNYSNKKAIPKESKSPSSEQTA